MIHEPSEAARLLMTLLEAGTIRRLDILARALKDAEERGACRERRRIYRSLESGRRTQDPDPPPSQPSQPPFHSVPVIVRSPRLN